jgi:hypothetical protein
MTYRITGTGTVPIDDRKATLGEAAYAASKMTDFGVTDVRVFDEAGRQVTEEELQAARIPGRKYYD